ncbi:uncharacterized protein LOC101461630 isoform X2 [Ceratitis capitata]|uniref:uncharacterized protein LOC101461630 isoform X2 n=2 Tax=Ceratitis capitata TaxID=7213 RepID=UPI0006188330|nr:uncharacterized protein LOC101461630 isoform X2 [Ceratitis capitata]
MLHSNMIASAAEFHWNKFSGQDRLKNVEPVPITNATCDRLRDKISKIEKSLNVASNIEICHTDMNIPSTSTSNASIINRSDANLPYAKSCMSPHDSERASSILAVCTLKSNNCVSKKFQRNIEEPMKVAPLSYANKLEDKIYASIITNVTSSASSASPLLNNTHQQKSNHHKAKCRGKLCRSQSRGYSVMGKTVETPTNGKTTKHLIDLTNTEVTQKIFIPPPPSVVPIVSVQNSMTLSTVELELDAAIPLAVPTLTLMFLHAPIFPQAWKQFVKLLHNSVEGLSAASQMSADRASPTTARKLSKKHLNDTRITSAATLITTEGTAASTKAVARRCKAAAAAVASVHSSSFSPRTKLRLLPSLGATSIFTLLTLICLETVLLSTVSSCAKTFYMHWNTSNSIFRIDNTDHIIDVNKGNLAFEFDQVHIICPVYEPGTYENETEKYIIYNVSKVEYETCRITNADPRVIAICDKPQKLMFFTITFRPFTPQPGGLEFLPGNDYYFISTSSKDDLYRRIGGRCSTNNMKVVFKVCCAPEEKNKTTIVGNGAIGSSSGGSGSTGGGGGSSGGAGVGDGNGMATGIDNSANIDGVNTQSNMNQNKHFNNINTIGINGVNTGLMPIGGANIGMNSGVAVNNGGMQIKPLNGASSTSINTNIDQFNRIPIQAGGIGSHSGGVMLTPGVHGGIHMISSGGGIGQYPGHHGQTGIRINNVASQQHHATHKNNNDDHFGKHPNEVVKNEELTYNSGATSTRLWSPWKVIYCAASYLIFNISGWILDCYNTSISIQLCFTKDKKQSTEVALHRQSTRSQKYADVAEFQRTCGAMHVQLHVVVLSVPMQRRNRISIGDASPWDNDHYGLYMLACFTSEIQWSPQNAFFGRGPWRSAVPASKTIIFVNTKFLTTLQRCHNMFSNAQNNKAKSFLVKNV